MAKDNDAYRQLWQRIHQSAAVDEVLQELDRLDNLVQVGELSLSNAYELRRVAFRTLQELTVDDAVRAQSVVLEYLLPCCVRKAADAPDDVRHAILGYRGRLIDWLNQYPEAERKLLRDEVLDRLRQGLESAQPEGTCWTIARIGFRRPNVVEALWEVARANANETGDVALFALTSLGSPPDDRAELLSALHGRAAIRCNRALVGALLRLADPESVDVVMMHWLRPDDVKADPMLAAVALRVLTEVADNADSDSNLQDRIWHALCDLFKENLTVLAHVLYLGRDVAPRCDSENVVPSLIGWLAEQDDGTKRTAHLRWLLSLRLEECVRPRQLKGWEQASQSPAVPLLTQDAMQDTQHRGLSVSIETRQKEMAWKVLLCLGYGDALGWFEEAVATETDPSTRRMISDLLASFCLDPVPPTALRWIRESYDVQPHDASREFLSRMAAVDLAQSAASWEAFEALLSFGLTVEGKVLQRSADALAVVAGELALQGEIAVAETLVETVENGPEARHRVAAASALESLAIAGLLSTKVAGRLSSLLSEQGRDEIELGEIAAVLGWLPDLELAPDVLRQLRTWAQVRDDWLGRRSLEALARTGHLLSQSVLLVERLGLVPEGDAWDWLPGKPTIEGVSFIIGMLYLQDHEKFTPAAASLLKQAQWHVALPVARLLCGVHGRPHQPPAPTAIREALIERILRLHTATYAETEVFDVLARLAPDALALQPWETIWHNMLPDARVALADALGLADYQEPASSSKAISQLLLLARDGQYAVRRAAYRGLARKSPETLQASCEGWSRAPAVELCQRAAEACSWLPASEGQPSAFAELHDRLAMDPERVVREAAERSRRERRERLWAQQYLSRILSSQPEANDELLALWRYGRALVRVGDDDCLKALRAELNKHRLPPHVRHWFRQLAKEIGERWPRVTQKWPEPWLPWEGAIEEGHAELLTAGQEGAQVRYSLWQQPAAAPGQQHSWGGAVWPADLWDAVGHRLVLQLEDGRRGTAVAGSLSGEVLTFHGEGPYPA